MAKCLKAVIAGALVFGMGVMCAYAEKPIKLQEDMQAEMTLDNLEGVASPQSQATQAIGEAAVVADIPATKTQEYMVGIDDVIEIVILQPEKLSVMATVSPDGNVTFPYIGSVQVKGATLSGIQEEVQTRLADGYMKYPVVVVTLKESRSQKFFVYGEVVRPGTYFLEENTTVLKAITMAGGFTKYGSSSRVKVLREKENAPGYMAIKVNMKAVMDGVSTDDVVVEPNDIVVVSEGIF
ncbi:MAG: polysaccharide biosynthesis/export family protein [Candidatus Omnitrophota bacterium]